MSFQLHEQTIKLMNTITYYNNPSIDCFGTRYALGIFINKMNVTTP